MTKWDSSQIFQTGSKLRRLLTQTISKIDQIKVTRIMQTDNEKSFAKEKSKQYTMIKIFHKQVMKSIFLK